MIKMYFDTEFTGLKKDGDLISIGCEDDKGRTFYAEITDFNITKCDDWVIENVIKKLYLRIPFKRTKTSLEVKGTKKTVTKHFKEWLEDIADDIQFVSDVCHYDFVHLIDLFGSAFDLPKFVSPVCIDINDKIAKYLNISVQEAFDVTRENIVLEELKRGSIKKHNALYDAKVIKLIDKKIDTYSLKMEA